MKSVSRAVVAKVKVISACTHHYPRSCQASPALVKAPFTFSQYIVESKPLRMRFAPHDKSFPGELGAFLVKTT